MRSSVIVPVYNGEIYLERSLSALIASTQPPDDIVVVDDGSSDRTAMLASRFGARIITLSGGPRGPAAARNRGAFEASGDLLIFLDADVVVHPTTLERIARRFDLEPDVAAVFGSYDHHPADQGVVSRYKNLLHHFVHQHSRPEASTFWAGCGAIRRDVFRESGGFDESFQRPSIEDIDLGVRLTRAGYRIRSCPDVQATHLKRWTFISLIYTDFFLRAIPWTRLILRTGSIPNDLNTNHRSRYSALAAWMLIGLLAISPWLPWALLGLLPAMAVLQVCNAKFLWFLYRCGGIRLVAAGGGLHLLYYLYSSLAFVIIAAEQSIKSYAFISVGSRNLRSPPTETSERLSG